VSEKIFVLMISESDGESTVLEIGQ